MEEEAETNNFENRYRFENKIELNPDKIKEISENYSKATERNLEKMRKTPNRPESIKLFEEKISNKEERIKQLQEFKAKGGKVIGTFCIQVPEEIIYAAGAIPIRLSCGFYDSISPAEEIIPKNTCPLIKSSVGYNFTKINPFFELCDAVIIPTTCDGKRKMADILSNYQTVWTLDLPNNKDNPKAKDFWTEQIYDLKEKIEKLTKKKITKKSLKENIELLHKRTAMSREFFDLRKNPIPPISGRDSYLIFQTAFYEDISWWLNSTEKIIEELKENIKNKKFATEEDTPKIIITGSPLIWPNMKLLHTIEESGGIVVADDSCACGQYFYNPVEVDEWSMKAMIEGIADKALLPSVCPVFTHSDDRVDRLLEIGKQYKGEGVIYHVLRLCQVFDFEFQKINKVLEKESMPLIKIETEYSEEDAGQIKTRIEAFVEMMEARK